IDLLSHRAELLQWRDLLRALDYYGPEASAAIPHLVKLLDDPDHDLAVQAAMALSRIDPTDRRVIPRLREIYWANTALRHFARDPSQKLGEPIPQPPCPHHAHASRSTTASSSPSSAPSRSASSPSPACSPTLLRATPSSGATPCPTG